MKIDVLMKNVLWVIVAVYGVAIALFVYPFICPMKTHHISTLEDWSNSSPILFIRYDGLQYGDKTITEEHLVDMIKASAPPFVYYLAEPSADADRIAAVVQLLQDHGIYAWNLVESHIQKFLMQYWR